jgi:NAD(P)-dependent dehydrogenase (short-subunit alcohol dehydrogenase family)
MDFKGKVVLVTGSSRGIGRIIALGFARQGADVVINYPSSDEMSNAEGVAKLARKFGANVEIVQADVSVPKDVTKMTSLILSNLGRIDILVNNAGVCPFHDFLTMPLDLWQHVQDVNYKGVFLCSQEIAKVMIKKKIAGKIITISSIGAYNGNELQTHYNPSKAAASALMKSLAVTLGPYGITCNSILAGCIETDLNREYLSAPKVRENLVNRIPLQRIGTPEDIVGAVLFLASPEASYITGAEIRIDGGFFIRG